jgi:hypothetical protein
LGNATRARSGYGETATIQEQNSMPTLHEPRPTVCSPLVLADRLISLAQDADRAGYQDSATRLLGLAYAVFDEEPRVRN